MSANLDTALRLAARGFRVFPLIAGTKFPAIDAWPDKASAQPEAVEAMWTDAVTGWLQNHDIGIATGRGVMAVDIDVKDGKRGAESWEALDLVHGAPSTLTFRTLSGGSHLIFKTREPVGNGASKIAQDVDHRGERGFIKFYPEVTESVDGQITDAPPWLVDMAGAPSLRVAATGEIRAGSTLDANPNVQRAINFLERRAPAAIEGAGGDHTTYSVAASVKDFGVSEAACLDLMLEYWNDNCAPPWLPAELKAKVANAYRYGKNPIGQLDPDADFEPAPAAPKLAGTGARTSLQIRCVDFIDEMVLPRRRFLLGRHIQAGKVRVLVAPGGTGKSSLGINWALAVATGREDISGAVVHEIGGAWIVNAEDDADEMRRRIAATVKIHRVEWSEVGGRLFITDGTESPFIVAHRTQDRAIAETAQVEAAIAAINAQGVKLLIVDPLIETHDADENSNGEMRLVIAFFRKIAQQTGCAVILVHHTRKPSTAQSEGHAGNSDSGRGASAIRDGSRGSMTLYEMGSKDAERFGVPVDECSDYVRLDGAKENYSRKAKSTLWFRKESVALANGDDVGALVPVLLASRDEAAEREEASRLKRIADLVAGLIPAGGNRISVSSLADQLRTNARPDLSLGSRATVTALIARAFDLPVEVGGALWRYQNEQAAGSKTVHWLVREARAA